MKNLDIPLPHQTDRVFLTDGGIETSLIYLQGLKLPRFAAYPLLETERGRDALYQYYRPYAELAVRQGLGFVLESPTWRANPDWAAQIGHSPAELQRLNREAIGLMHRIRETFETPDSPFIISGCVGPRGDGYAVDATMTPVEAEAYHAPQIKTYRDAGADLTSTITFTYPDEAIGVANAAADLGVQAVIAFTVETDGTLPSGHSLHEAIEMVDSLSNRAPAYYMINCAHPTHFSGVLRSGTSWCGRIVGIRANASCRSHAELDDSTDLDRGDPVELANRYRELQAVLPNLRVFGGCCGTDYTHIESICSKCIPTTRQRSNVLQP